MYLGFLIYWPIFTFYLHSNKVLDSSSENPIFFKFLDELGLFADKKLIERKTTNAVRPLRNKSHVKF
jgi:hypothetical protein